MNNTNDKIKFKEEISNHIVTLLNDDWFKSLYFCASDETMELEDSIKSTLCKYTPCFNEGSSNLFEFTQVRDIIAHNIYRAIAEKINDLYNNKDISLNNGDWSFSKKSYTIKSISKKITESVFHRTRNDKKENIIKLPTFFNESLDHEDGNYKLEFF